MQSLESFKKCLEKEGFSPRIEKVGDKTVLIVCGVECRSFIFRFTCNEWLKLFSLVVEMPSLFGGSVQEKILSLPGGEYKVIVKDVALKIAIAWRKFKEEGNEEWKLFARIGDSPETENVSCVSVWLWEQLLEIAFPRCFEEEEERDE